MPGLSKTRLKGKIKDILVECREFGEQENSESAAAEYFADELATAIIDEIKESVIVYQTGLTAPNGPVAGTFQGHLK